VGKGFANTSKPLLALNFKKISRFGSPHAPRQNPIRYAVKQNA
jgi:hypothetical protein